VLGKEALYIVLLWALFPILIVNTALKAQTQTENISPDGTKFLLYKPPDSSLPSPMLVYLHGGASIGDDLNKILTNSHITPPRLIHDGKWPSDRPFVVLSPQLKRDESIPNPNDQEWSMDTIREVVTHVLENYNIDENRIYFSGISLGGAACWKYAATFPEQVAGIIPFSGKTDTLDACNLVDIPIWAFHGSNDGLVVPEFSIDMVNAIKSCTPGNYIPNLTLFQSRKHEGWNETYNGANGYRIYDWMLMFSKDNLSNTSPYVNAGFDKNIFLETEFNAFFENFDWDNDIDLISWTKLSGPNVTMTYDQNSSFLNLKNINPGSYSFKLEAIDTEGSVNSDTININVIEQPAVDYTTIDSLILYDGEDGAPIGPVVEDQIINLQMLGTERLNFEAIANDATVSVLYQINGAYHTVKTGNAPPFFFRDPSKPNHWLVENGEYQICAIPFEQSGVRGDPGISLCHKLSVFNQPLKIFYQKDATDVTELSSWSDLQDGTGNPPLSFIDNFQEFRITQNTSIDNNWDISGIGSYLRIEEGYTLTINAAFTGTVRAQANSEIEIFNDSQIVFDSLDTSSTVSLYANMLVPSAIYGNLQLFGPNTVKELSSQVTVVKGDFFIDENVKLNADPTESSKIDVYGNINDNGETSNIPYTLRIMSGSSQELHTNQSSLLYKEIDIKDSTALTLSSSHADNSTVRLGTANGGGIKIGDGALLNLHANFLSIENSGCINAENKTGVIAVSGSNLGIDSDTDNNSYLNFHDSLNNLNILELNLVGVGEVFINNQVLIDDEVLISNGTLNCNDGHVVLLSDASNTARIGRVENSGLILGEIVAQRYMEDDGNIWRYVGPTVPGTTVIDWQNYMPITGNFPESTPGLGSNPSLYYYDEPNGGWTAFPVSSGTEEFVMGRGYAIFVREELTLEMQGEPHQGDFTFALTPDPDAGNSDDGWNLLGNPYASPIQWDSVNWIASGMNNSVWVRDNAFGGGRFVTWDDEGVGDAEFGGKIASGQSFWVQTIDSNPVLTVTEQAKPEQNEGVFFVTPETNSGPVDFFTITLRDDDLYDRAYVKFRDGSTDQYNPQSDTRKRANAYFNLSTLSSDSVPLAINSLSAGDHCEKSVFLNIEDAGSSNYSLEFTDFESFNNVPSLQLVDHYLDSTVYLNVSSHYLFSINEDPQSKGNARFEVIIHQPEADLDLQVLSEELVCDQDEFASVMIRESQQFVFYQVSLAGNLVGDQVQGNGLDLELKVPSSILSPGENIVELVTTVSGCASEMLNNTVVIELVETPVVSGAESYEACSESSVLLSASGAAEGGGYKWYEDSISEQSIIVGATSAEFQTPALMQEKRYFVKAVNELGCESLESLEIHIEVRDLPDIIPDFEKDICQGESTELTVTGGPVGGQYKWYETNDDSSLIKGHTTNQFITPELMNSRSYYVSVIDQFGCESSEKAEVRVNVLSLEVPEIRQEGGSIAAINAGGQYQWFHNGDTLSGATENTIDPVESGEYFLSVTNNGCAAASNLIFFSVTGEEEVTNNLIRIYPNPVKSGPVNVIGQFPNSGDIQIHIFDLLGKNRFSTRVSHGRVKNGIQLDLKNKLIPGTYILTLEQGGAVIKESIIIE